jgi:hypothetical protein
VIQQVIGQSMAAIVDGSDPASPRQPRKRGRFATSPEVKVVVLQPPQPVLIEFEKLKASHKRKKTKWTQHFTPVVHNNEVKLKCDDCAKLLQTTNPSRLMSDHPCTAKINLESQALPAGITPFLLKQSQREAAMQDLSLFFYTSGLSFRASENSHLCSLLERFGMQSPSRKVFFCRAHCFLFLFLFFLLLTTGC